MTDWTPLATADELQAGQRKSGLVDDEPVLLIRVEDTYYAIEDLCTHDGQPLTDGPLEGTAITCPRHGASFDLACGRALCMPATEPIGTYEVTVQDGHVLARTRTAATAPTVESESLPVSVDGHGDDGTASTTVDGAPADPGAKDPADVDAGIMLEALREVIDPELMINIVDLGLIYDVRQDGGQVHVDMTLTSPACPAGPQLIQQSKLALEQLEGVDEAEIALVMTPPWTPERMTAEARDQLGIF